jgi:hypothetical protein
MLSLDRQQHGNRLQDARALAHEERPEPPPRRHHIARLPVARVIRFIRDLLPGAVFVVLAQY